MPVHCIMLYITEGVHCAGTLYPVVYYERRYVLFFQMFKLLFIYFLENG